MYIYYVQIVQWLIQRMNWLLKPMKLKTVISRTKRMLHSNRVETRLNCHRFWKKNYLRFWIILIVLIVIHSLVPIQIIQLPFIHFANIVLKYTEYHRAFIPSKWEFSIQMRFSNYKDPWIQANNCRNMYTGHHDCFSLRWNKTEVQLNEFYLQIKKTTH